MLFKITVVVALATLLYRQYVQGIRQEKIMADIDTLNTTVTELAADEATIATDLGTILADFKAAEAALASGTAPDLSGPIAALQSLHNKLVADDASIVAAEPVSTNEAAS